MVILSAGLASCSVYAPMLPAAPQIRAKGQVEVVGTSFLNRRWEAGVTYSPANYMLVRAAGGIRTSNRDSASARSRQYELAVGGYYPLGRSWLVSGMGGYGQARTSYNYWDGGIILPRTYQDFKSCYRRQFGELAVSYYLPGRRSGVTLGVAYRLSGVRFDELTYNGQPVMLRHLTRHEPLVFCRFGSPDAVVPWVRVQLAVGASNERQRPFDPGRTYAEARVREGIPYMALSLVLLPHLFHQANPEPAR